MKARVGVVVKCIGCGKKRIIAPNEVSEDDVPMCPKCYMPMLVEKAIVKKQVTPGCPALE